MIGTVFRSEDVAPEDRFDHWRELISRTHAPSDMSSDYAADFRAEQRLLQLGPVTVWPGAFQPMRFRRTARMVRQSDPELYHVSLVLGGGLGVDHAGRADTHGPQSLYVVDTSQPYEVGPPEDDCGVNGVGVELPKALVPVSPDRVGDLLARRLSAQEGVGALLSGFLTGVAEQADTLQPSDVPRLGAVVLDLLLAWFAQELDTESALPPETRHRTLTAHIRAFMRRNLHDPDLAPPVIAAAHHISVSHLHRLFQQQNDGVTVAAWIRAQRLEGARRDLADPALRATPVHAVGARWGLNRPAEFSRAFRTAYGIPPTEYRLRASAPTAQNTQNARNAQSTQSTQTAQRDTFTRSAARRGVVKWESPQP
ncbi:helix-turn-helix domain-containing protein [Streptomyces graminilatus]|uniref:AraC-like ligand-binding domain-containing protein n=1 Tax=Streptomyces graminilatus TaxID=1464070 RepID=UPI00099E83AC|nr:helix-turn-helix domain-containing protein [Streptomyces graminilatus]